MSTTDAVPDITNDTKCFFIVQVMHKSFAHWQRLFVRLRIAGGRAAATWEWKTMLRAWREWKMAVEEKQKEKTFDVTSAVQNELRLVFCGVDRIAWSCVVASVSHSGMIILDDQARQQMTLHLQLSLQCNVSPITGFVRHTAHDG